MEKCIMVYAYRKMIIDYYYPRCSKGVIATAHSDNKAKMKSYRIGTIIGLIACSIYTYDLQSEYLLQPNTYHRSYWNHSILPSSVSLYQTNIIYQKINKYHLRKHITQKNHTWVWFCCYIDTQQYDKETECIQPVSHWRIRGRSLNF